MTIADLSQFFSAPNEVDLASLDEGSAELIRLLAARLEGSDTRTVLPARVDGNTRWYGFASSAREARILKDEMRAWLGSPLAGPISVVGVGGDALDMKAAALSPEATLVRADVVAGWHTDARANVTSLLETWTLAPPRGIERPRPVGRVLREFYESLLAFDRNAAEASLEDIKARSLLSPANVRYLRVELLSAVGTPEELRDDPSLQGISLLTRPPAVTNRIAVAANALFIAPALLATPNSPDWPSVAEALEDAWPGLVQHPGQVRSVEGARCLAVSETLAASPRPRVLAELAGRWPDDDVLASVKVLFPDSKADILAPPGRGFLECYNDGDFELALAAIDVGEATRQSATVALAAAMNLGDSGSAVRALAIVDGLEDTLRAGLMDQAVERSFYEQLVARTSDSKVPTDWLNWCAGEWPDRPDLLLEWSSEWDRSREFLRDSGAELAGELLDALNDNRRSRTRNGLPVFTDWLLSVDGLEVEGVALAATVLDIMLSSEPGRTERQAALLLLDAILDAGCSGSEYADTLNALTTQLRVIGPRDASWLVQAIDLVVGSSCPSPAPRSSFVSECWSLVQSWGDRVDPTDLIVLSQVLRDAGLELHGRLPAAAGSDDAQNFVRAFRAVGIYSLLEPAARTAARWIVEMWPEAQVELSHDHVNSRALEALVAGSDVILVQTSHAKHAATHAIEAAVNDKSKLVLVHGRGASSLLRGLLGWAGDMESVRPGD